MQDPLNNPVLLEFKEEALLVTALRIGGEISFRDAVYRVVSTIPEGYVLGYGEVAALMGSPRAARQVGAALKALSPEQSNPQIESAVPWWRVLRTSGQIALQGDPIRPSLQRKLLEEEGIEVSGDLVNMERFGLLSKVVSCQG